MGSTSGRKAKEAEDRRRKLGELFQYYATGAGKEVPVERVAAHCGVDVKTARFHLRGAGRET